MSSKTIQPSQSKRPAPFLRFLQTAAQVTGGLALGVTVLASSVTAGILVGLSISFRNLPDVRTLHTFTPSETTYIYDIAGKSLASIHGEANREVVPLKLIAPDLKRAVLAIEDSNFYSHHGVNPISVLRALTANLKQGATVEGASTITMQLVKNLFLSPERTFNRKMAEAVLALHIEQVFTKNEILAMYLNQVYWGHNNYGVETAAQSYFNKSAADLTLAEAAMMAGFIQAPEDLSPFVCNPGCSVDSQKYKRSKTRQAVVLQRMRELQWITSAEQEAALQQPIRLGRVSSFLQSESPYVTDAVIQELTLRFGQDAVRKGGMRVQATVDSELQKIGQETVRRWHQNLNQSGLKADQMALVAVDPRTHFVKALVGGIDYNKSQFNRVIQARRQPGSAFKPFVYYTAFASGKYTPDSVIEDTPAEYWDGAELYRPQNYDRSFQGPISIRTALTYSRNVPVVKLGQSVGLDKVIEVCRILDIKSPIEPVISLPLGAIDVTPLELAGAYATFASNGWHSETTYILQVRDSRGKLLLDNTPKPRLVLDPWATATLTNVLQSVITSGTGRGAALSRPAAGKTGTTSSERDIWFVGYVPQLATAVWVGNDDYRPIGGGATGGGFVAPIWRDFMTRALADTPVEQFKPASNFPRPQD